MLERAADMSGRGRAILQATIRARSGELSGSRGEPLLAWINVRPSLMAARDDDAILAECERGEFVAEHIFRNALGEDLPRGVKQVIAEVYQGITEEHAKIRTLRERLSDEGR